MKKVGKDGVITVEESKTMATELQTVEGMQFDRGYLSPYFVTDAERMEVVLEDPYILIHEKKISQHEGSSSAARADRPFRPSDADHCGRSGRRSAGHPRGQQAARHSERLRREGSGLRRSPQGHAGRHRDPHGRPRHLRRNRHQAGRREARRSRQGQARHRRQRQHDHRRRRGSGQSHRRPHQTVAHRRSTKPPRITTARSCRSGWRSLPAALR